MSFRKFKLTSNDLENFRSLKCVIRSKMSHYDLKSPQWTKKSFYSNFSFRLSNFEINSTFLSQEKTCFFYWYHVYTYFTNRYSIYHIISSYSSKSSKKVSSSPNSSYDSQTVSNIFHRKIQKIFIKLVKNRKF